MKLFDFKFLILLGLALVIYFMYKELEYHRERLTFCEEKIKELSNHNTTPHTLNQDKIEQLELDENNLIPLPQPPSIQKNYPTVQQENKNLNISLPVTTLTSLNMKKISEQSLEETSSSESSLLTSTNSTTEKKSFQKESESKHLEIYSNDNENNLETTISDSLMASKKIQSLSESSASETLSESSKTFLSESELSSGKKSEKLNEESSTSNFLSDDKSSSDKSSSSSKNKSKLSPKKLTETNSSQELDNVIDALKNEIDNSDKSSEVEETHVKKNDINTLNKMKLTELQNLAKNENLSLDKKVNGQPKKKTKQELIEELSKI